jgi:hypothetical protein
MNSISLQGSTLSMDVPAVSGAYQGSLEGDNIIGTWSQQGQGIELNLERYEEPVLTAESFAIVSGSWVGSIRPVPTAEMELTIVLDFEETEGGEYRAALSSPDQGAMGIPVDSFTVDGDEVNLRIAQMRLEINGTVNGEQFTGTFTQAGRELPLNLQKGEYQREGLAMPALTYARLQGPWHGEVGGVNVMIRIEQTGDSYHAYLDSPDQGASGIPVSTLELDGNNLLFTVTTAGVEFQGEVGDEAIVGTWSQGGQSLPLTLMRGAYDPAAGLDAAARERLAGTWRGRVNDTELVFQFGEMDGGYGASLAIPAMGASGLGLSDMNLEGGELSFQVRGIQASFTGNLADDQLSGQWTRAGNTSDLALTPDP